MSAEFSVVTSNTDSDYLRRELQLVLTAYEYATSLHVCIRPLSERWRDAEGLEVIPESFAIHRSSFCSNIKSRFLSACMTCDSTALPDACHPPSGRIVRPFVRTCHAGADEVLTPLWSDGMLVAVIFLGQFKQQVDDPSKPGCLEGRNEASVQHVRALSLALRAYLLNVLRHLDHQRNGSSTGRRGVIETYIRENISTGPTLSELATKLSLSRSRTSHAVRESTGQSFQNLVTERRIAAAKDLLASTDGTVAWIAGQTGFSDIAYFSRFFKRHVGSTPTAFRKQYRTVTSV